jgi:hypothetical protein
LTGYTKIIEGDVKRREINKIIRKWILREV